MEGSLLELPLAQAAEIIGEIQKPRHRGEKGHPKSITYRKASLLMSLLALP